jgi:hypothetical protein
MSSENPPGVWSKEATTDNQQERPSIEVRPSASMTQRTGSREKESSEAIRRAPNGSVGMKRWSGPHGDMGKTVSNYNRPKVAKFLVG